MVDILSMINYMFCRNLQFLFKFKKKKKKEIVVYVISVI
jgi:hypothetical protein